MSTEKPTNVPWPVWAAVTLLAAMIPIFFQTFNGDDPPDDPPLVTPTDESEHDAPADPLVGVWEQHIYDDYGYTRLLGKFIVMKQNGAYVMGAKEQLRSPDVINSSGIFDVTYHDGVWTFKSDWGDGQIAYFKLARVSDKGFEGASFLQGYERSKNRRIKVA